MRSYLQRLQDTIWTKSFILKSMNPQIYNFTVLELRVINHIVLVSNLLRWGPTLCLSSYFL